MSMKRLSLIESLQVHKDTNRRLCRVRKLKFQQCSLVIEKDNKKGFQYP